MEKKKSYTAPATLTTVVDTAQMLAGSINSETGNTRLDDGDGRDWDGSDLKRKIKISDPGE